MKETTLSENGKKTESELINYTDNIVSYLLDIAKPLLEGSVQ